MNLLLTTVNRNHHHHHHHHNHNHHKRHDALFNQNLDKHCQSLNSHLKNKFKPILTDYNNNNCNHENDKDNEADEASQLDQYDYDGDNEDDTQIKKMSKKLEENLFLKNLNDTDQQTNDENEIKFLKFSSYVNKNMSERQIRAQFYKDYSLGCRIGEGGFGIIFSGIRRKDNRTVAIKVIKKAKVNQWYEFESLKNNELAENQQDVEKLEEEQEMITRRIPLEIALMIRVKHVKNCIEIIDYLEQNNCFIIVMERIENSKDLFDYITEKNGYGGLNESICKEYFRQIVDAILAIHNLGVLHRDIKDENILVDMNTNQIKLIDFGAGAFFNTTNKTKEDLKFNDFHGTRVYSPPEWILSQCYYGDRAAVWSLGVLLFNMIYGDIPWEEDSDIVNCRLNSKKNINLKKQSTTTNSSQVSDVDDLIKMCLHINQYERIKLNEILNHKWFK